MQRAAWFHEGTLARCVGFGVLILYSHICYGDTGERGLPLEDPRAEVHYGQAVEMTSSSSILPRILTVLTTYKERTKFIKAYREAAADRADGFAPLIFVTSNEEDEDPDGVIDYKFGEPSHHRLLAALAEANSRYSGQFDWIAAGDDDSVFMYRRAMALLRYIDHTQPVAIGMVHGLCGVDNPTPHPGPCQCFTPEQKQNVSATRALGGCCLDFTHPCEVPARPEYGMNDTSIAEFCERGFSVYDGDLYWPYGGTGFFLSVGLMATVERSRGGWKRCRELFHGATDTQVASCLVAHGRTMSSFDVGFYRPSTAVPNEIRDYLSSNCQVIGVHAGIRHLRGHSQHAVEKFKAAISAVWAEDNAQTWLTDRFLQKECPQTWDELSTWK